MLAKVSNQTCVPNAYSNNKQCRIFKKSFKNYSVYILVRKMKLADIDLKKSQLEMPVL